MPNFARGSRPRAAISVLAVGALIALTGCGGGTDPGALESATTGTETSTSTSSEPTTSASETTTPDPATTSETPTDPAPPIGAAMGCPDGFVDFTRHSYEDTYQDSPVPIVVEEIDPSADFIPALHPLLGCTLRVEAPFVYDSGDNGQQFTEEAVTAMIAFGLTGVTRDQIIAALESSGFAPGALGETSWSNERVPDLGLYMVEPFDASAEESPLPETIREQFTGIAVEVSLLPSP